MENRNETDIQTSKTLSNENIKISARSDLENFFHCTRKWIFKTVLKLKEDSLDTDLMQPYDIGNLNHKVLELFVSSFTGKRNLFCNNLGLDKKRRVNVQRRYLYRRNRVVLIPTES